MSSHPQVRLVAATVPLLNALNDDRSLFGELIGSPVPDGWPEFPEAIGFTLEHLQNASEADRSWSMQFFVDHATGRLVGSGGFAAPPRRAHCRDRLRGRSRVPGPAGSALPLPGHWSSVPSPAARSITSSRTPCPARIRPRACSCRWASSTSTTRRTPRSASSGSGDGPGRRSDSPPKQSLFAPAGPANDQRESNDQGAQPDQQLRHAHAEAERCQQEKHDDQERSEADEKVAGARPVRHRARLIHQQPAAPEIANAAGECRRPVMRRSPTTAHTAG